MNEWIITLSHLDGRLLDAIVHRRRPALDRLMRLVTRLADVRLILPATLLLALGVVPSFREVGVFALETLVGSHLVVQILKRTITRERPTLPVGLSFLIEPEDRFSFPSGHATAGLSVALPLAAALGGPLGTCVLLLGLLIGLSRCYLGVHYPGDVLAGWLLAVGAVAAGVLLG